jgi:hypothetical protein
MQKTIFVKKYWGPATSVGLGCLILYTSDRLTWTGANVFCQKQENATLVEIQTEKRKGFIKIYLELLEDQTAYDS